MPKVYEVTEEQLEEAAGGLRMKVGPGARSRYIRVEEKGVGIDVDRVPPGSPIRVDDLDDDLLKWAAGGTHRMLIRRGLKDAPQYAIRVQEVEDGDLEAATGGIRMHSERVRPPRGIGVEEKDGEIDIYVGKARPPLKIHFER